MQPTAVHRYHPTAVWEHDHAWDDNDPTRTQKFRVERNDLGISVVGGNSAVTFPPDMFRWLIEAVASAAEWEDRRYEASDVE